MALVACLEGPRALAGVDAEHFTNPDIQRVILGLKEKNTDELRSFFAAQSVMLPAGELTGKAIRGALLETVKRRTLLKRHERFEKKAEFELRLCRGKPDAFQRTLERLQRESKELSNGET